jgi:hypothetical protein
MLEQIKWFDGIDQKRRQHQHWLRLLGGTRAAAAP